MQRVLDEAEQGDSRALGLRGEPGIGKSRLLSELNGARWSAGTWCWRAGPASWSATCPALLVDALDEDVTRQDMRALERVNEEHLAQLAAGPALRPRGGRYRAGRGGRAHRVARAVRALIELMATSGRSRCYSTTSTGRMPPPPTWSRCCSTGRRTGAS